MFRVILLCLLMVSFNFGCSLQQRQSVKTTGVGQTEIGDLVEGWNEMLSTIRKSSDNPSSLQGKSFLLRIKLQGEWKLNIAPMNAFNVERIDMSGKRKVTVINPGLLFEQKGGLTTMSYIRAQLSKMGGQRGNIDLQGQIACLFETGFYQDNKRVDLEKLKEAFEYEVIISHPDIVELYAQTPRSLIFRRLKDNRTEVSVKLLLKDINSDDTYMTDTVSIPICNAPGTQGINAVMETLSPGQCIRHIYTSGDVFIQGKGDGIEIAEIFGNSCQKSVQCKLIAKYGLVNNGEIAFADSKHFTFIIPPYQSVRVDTSWIAPKDKSHEARIYTASTISKDAIPQQRLLELDERDYLQCIWVRP